MSRARRIVVSRVRLAVLAGALGAALACSGILGIEDPVIERPALFDAAADREGDPDGDAASPGDGGLACAAPRADCTGGPADGCETDLQTSPEHCGACGHSCLTTACDGGKCQPQVLLTGSPPTDYSGFVGLNTTRAFWSNGVTRGVYSVPKDGGTFQQHFGTTAFEPTTLDVHESYFLSADYALYGVVKFPIAGGASEDPRIDAGCALVLGAIADETGAVYYAHVYDGATCTGAMFHITKRIPGAPYTTAWDIAVSTYSGGMSEWMALDAQSLYFASRGIPGAAGIYAMPRGGGSPALVSAGSFDNAPLALEGGQLFTVSASASNDASVIAIDVAAKTKKVLATGERAFLPNGSSNVRGQIAADATHVYWTAAQSATTGRISRIRRDGTGTKETIVDNEPAAFGMAIDGSFVYWSTATAIKRVAK
ncbi:MAG TPA: hypothetical protein VLT33_46130 [Labilithrix sp.]|nr:hypothetical protein [Labilithrix sp.]